MGKCCLAQHYLPLKAQGSHVYTRHGHGIDSIARFNLAVDK